jgi:hypothetical protein
VLVDMASLGVVEQKYRCLVILGDLVRSEEEFTTESQHGQPQPNEKKIHHRATEITEKRQK